MVCGVCTSAGALSVGNSLGSTWCLELCSYSMYYRLGREERHYFFHSTFDSYTLMRQFPLTYSRCPE